MADIGYNGSMRSKKQTSEKGKTMDKLTILQADDKLFEIGARIIRGMEFDLQRMTARYLVEFETGIKQILTTDEIKSLL